MIQPLMFWIYMRNFIKREKVKIIIKELFENVSFYVLNRNIRTNSRRTYNSDLMSGLRELERIDSGWSWMLCISKNVKKNYCSLSVTCAKLYLSFVTPTLNRGSSAMVSGYTITTSWHLIFDAFLSWIVKYNRHK